jgi:hypothetical protein
MAAELYSMSIRASLSPTPPQLKGDETDNCWPGSLADAVA